MAVKPFVKIVSALLTLAAIGFRHRAFAVERCSVDQGDGMCPDGNTCCRRLDGSSGCIPDDMGKHNATCCPDMKTGCPFGYACDADIQKCFMVNRTAYTDSLVRQLPRYHLCNAKAIDNVYGLSVGDRAEMAYYSSHGPIELLKTEDSDHAKSTGSVDMALVMIHGAGRNGDDYFCSATAAVDMQDNFMDVLVIAPQFYSSGDHRPRPSLLYWKDDTDGPWRYGAKSRGPRHVSSFAALDTLVETLLTTLPTLKRLVIAGHSSGGQTVQRWTLLTLVWSEQIEMVAVVANPSSYAYLTPLRFVNDAWKIPKDCPQYNQWEWGLTGGGNMEVPYRNRKLKNATKVIERFRTRQVFYLNGVQDRCNVSGSGGWCHSHGLETTCMDEIQGNNRLVRSARYLASLEKLGFGDTHHVRHVVPGVGHDHTMMFQSPIGIATLFGSKYSPIKDLT